MPHTAVHLCRVILTSIFSSGNAYVYGTSRSLYSLALAGHLPKALTLVNRNGVPWVCVTITIAVSCLSYLQVSSGSAVVLKWWTNLVTGSWPRSFSASCSER